MANSSGCTLISSRRGPSPSFRCSPRHSSSAQRRSPSPFSRAMNAMTVSSSGVALGASRARVFARHPAPIRPAAMTSAPVGAIATLSSRSRFAPRAPVGVRALPARKPRLAAPRAGPLRRRARREGGLPSRPRRDRGAPQAASRRRHGRGRVPRLLRHRRRRRRRRRMQGLRR